MTTVEEWRRHLLEEWRARQHDIAILTAYYGGAQALPPGPSKLVEATTRLLQLSRLNMCELVVDSLAQRLEVTGFRAGKESAHEGAWKLWTSNHLDADSAMLTSDALALKSSYVLVWPNADADEGVDITVEHPTQCVVWYEAGSMRHRAAGIKVWHDQMDDRAYLTLYLPDEVYKWVSRTRVKDSETIGTRTQWVARETAGETWPIANELGVVPLVEFRARPKLLGWGRTEITPGVVDIQDRINKTIYDRVVAQEYAAFRQRWATGMEIEYDEEGRPIEPFKAAIDRLWVAEEGVTFGEFSESDITGYLKAVEADVLHLGATTQTPPHYLLGSMTNVSGDALKAAETGLSSKARKRMKYLGEAYEEVMRLALEARGPQDGEAELEVDELEVIWADPESRSEGETVDAAVKLKAIGVADEVLQARIGMSSQEIIRNRTMRLAESFSAARAAAPGTAQAIGTTETPPAGPPAPTPSGGRAPATPPVPPA